MCLNHHTKQQNALKHCYNCLHGPSSKSLAQSPSIVCSVSMYDFSHLLQKPETHDVLFKTSHGHSAGFIKVLLLGLSEMWRTRAEHWKECCDADGCIQHTVDLDFDTAQEVLDALQAAVFTSQLPEEFSWQVLVQLAKMADAELMPTVLELAADSLKAACLQDAVAVIKTAPEKASGLILCMDSAIGHIQHKGLSDWLAGAAWQLADPIADQADLMIVLLNELPANSMAALGVLRAAWPKLPKGRVPNQLNDSSRAYHHAILRHKQVMLDHPTRDFLSEAEFYGIHGEEAITNVLASMCRTYLGPPSAVLASTEAFNKFWAAVFPSGSSNGLPLYRLWKLYVSGPDLSYLKLMLKVHEKLDDLGFTAPCLERPAACTITRLCGGPENFMQLSADDLEQLLLPVLRLASSDQALVSAVQAMVAMKRQGGGKGRRRRRGGAARNNAWPQ